MDHERTGYRKKSGGMPTGARDLKPRRAAKGFLLLEALPMLVAAAAFVASSVPQAPESAATRSYAPADIVTGSSAADQGDRTPDAIDEAYEPLMTDDLRAVGVMYARAGGGASRG